MKAGFAAAIASHTGGFVVSVSDGSWKRVSP
jgi:hypothetical protein